MTTLKRCLLQLVMENLLPCTRAHLGRLQRVRGQAANDYSRQS